MKRPELMVTNGTLAGRRFAVGDGGLRLGRSSSNDIHVPDERLSRNHCLFEIGADGGLRVTDLASANGTFLNGRALGSDPAALRIGDLIEVGNTVLRVVGDEPASAGATVDLGLSATKGAAAPVRRRSVLANVLWLVAIAAAGAAIAIVLKTPSGGSETAAARVVEEDPVVCEASYEKVEAGPDGIFRYEMILSADGVLAVAVDDVPKENRHLTRREPLDERSLAESRESLSGQALRDLDREYAGAEPDPPALNSWTLKVVYSTRARTVRVINTTEPEAFRAIRERLEAFSKNQLGIWALQYSRDKLVELAEAAVVLGRTKWEDRDVQHGNLFAAVAAYQEALFYLETVDPKPACGAEARRGLEEARNELDRRYRDQRFLADRAIKLGQWDTAQRELSVLIEMIPDRADERNREASAKLIDVEKRVKGGK